MSRLIVDLLRGLGALLAELWPRLRAHWRRRDNVRFHGGDKALREAIDRDVRRQLRPKQGDNDAQSTS